MWSAWFGDEPRVRQWKDTAVLNPEAERRYVDILRGRVRRAGLGCASGLVYDRPSTTFLLTLAGGQTGGE